MSLGENQKIAAADRLLDAEFLLDEELPVHHRDAPVSTPGERLARLILVAEVPQLPADVHAFGGLRQTVETRGGRAGQDRLPDSLDETVRQTVSVEAEQQHAHAGPPIGGCVRPQLRLDSRLDLASDHRRREPGHRLRARPSPARRGRRDHDPRRAHVERLGERIDDPHAPPLHVDARLAVARHDLAIRLKSHWRSTRESLLARGQNYRPYSACSRRPLGREGW